ncbi:hypothetical protein ACHAXS_014213 [Conticribra weissflogii]
MMTMKSSSSSASASGSGGVGGDSSSGTPNKHPQQQQQNLPGMTNTHRLPDRSSAPGSSTPSPSPPSSSKAPSAAAAAAAESPSSSSVAPAAPSLPHPNHSATLALLCVQNALQMNTRTKFYLCPPGKARKALLARARQQSQGKGGSGGHRPREFHRSRSAGSVSGETRWAEWHERAEDEFLKNPPPLGGRHPHDKSSSSLEDYSSGDDDDYDISLEGAGISKLVVDRNANKPNNYAATSKNAKQKEQKEEPLFSLAMNHLESLEGMAKCYDGIVSAGTALLDIANEDNSSSTSTSVGAAGESTASTNKPSANTPSTSAPHNSNNPNNNQTSKKKLTTHEIMSALTPLLITTLSQPTGEAILALSHLRSYCPTQRYRRRFVQRIAPFLVRPPDAAVWCLRHHSDMEPIMAAVEMILENAGDVFGPGWYDRGRAMLKDSRRGETFRKAASQLRRLACPSPSDGLLGVLGSGAVGGGLMTLRRSHSFGTLVRKEVGIGGSGSAGNEGLAEWEIMAVDTHIRQSILDVFSRDWSRISSLNLSPKEGETPFGSRSRRGISAGKFGRGSADMPHELGSPGQGIPNNAGNLSAAALAKSPRSKIPLSPRGMPMPGAATSQTPSADALESTFGPSFSSQVIIDDGADNSLPIAPLSPKRESICTKLNTPKTPPSHHGQRADPDQPSIYPGMPSESSPSSPYRGSNSDSRMGLAPLSPQSSVGNASHSSLGALSQRSGPSGSSVMRDQYRALTSTAAERKRTVAACRALRAQIAQFEDAFIQMHGRAPKGAAERAPLASTYMQYREWKRAIRSDAACRIQALCRGACVRWALMRDGDPRIATISSLQSVKLPSAYRRSRHPNKPIETGPGHLKDLSIPTDLGDQDVHRLGGDSPLARTRLETRTGQRGDDGVEVEMVITHPNAATSSSNVLTSPPSHWVSRQQHPHGGGSSTTSRSLSLKPRSGLPDVTMMSLAELQQRKRELKQQLKLYDMNFHKQHGRMPEKREKEPIRHLYESYNAYKNQISIIEKGEAQPGPGTAAFRGEINVTVSNPITDNSADGASPTHFIGNSTSPSLGNFKKPSGLNEGEEDNFQQHNEINASAASSQDLAALKAEKATLHQMLRSYEKDFFKQHKRQVSSFSDIRPVASQYRRYKEIKKAIASLQDK